METATTTKSRPTAKTKSQPLARSGTENEDKRDRLHLRLDVIARHEIEQAAHYLNKTTSDFVLSQAVMAADKVIESHGHSMTLSEADWDRFCAVLDHPPKPNRKLMEAARRYARRGDEFAG